MTATWTCWQDATHETTTHEFGWPQCKECGAAPAYHERAAFLDERLNLTLYVPALPLTATLAPRSAIVGLPKRGGHVRVYFEGWVHGAAQYKDRDARGLWRAGVEHATSRMVTDYPTVAQMFVQAERLKSIGSYNPTTRELIVDDEEALDAWLNQ